jgi:YspA, cpYpsA-related SLOG family
MTFVGVTGGRDYDNVLFVRSILGQHFKLTDVLVQGGANGADALAKSWAEDHGHEVVTAHANWKFRGKSAGHRRNAVIAALPLRLLIAFPGGAGTTGMVKLARAKGIEVLEVAP